MACLISPAITSAAHGAAVVQDEMAIGFPHTSIQTVTVQGTSTELLFGLVRCRSQAVSIMINPTLFFEGMYSLICDIIHMLVCCVYISTIFQGLLRKWSIEA